MKIYPVALAVALSQMWVMDDDDAGPHLPKKKKQCQEDHGKGKNEEITLPTY